MGGSDPKATKIDFNDVSKYVAALGKNMPDVLRMEGKYRPKYQGLNLGDMTSFLQGSGGKAGIVDQSGRLANQAGKQLGQARGREIAQMTRQTGMTRNLMESLSPESAAAVRYANNNAAQLQRSAMGLTGSEQRTAQQFAREASADRGRVMDNSSMAAEVLNRDSILGAKRAEAAQATQNAYNLSNSFYSAPGLQTLSSVPNSYQAGMGLTNLGLGAIGGGKPQLIDMSAGLNLANANAQNKTAANAAGAQAQATRQSGYASAGAAAGGAAGGAYAGATYGTAAGPWGTLIGGIIGAGVGAAAGS